MNFFKAKVKNLVTVKNSEIASKNAVEQAKVSNENSVLRAGYDSAVQKWHDDAMAAEQMFEKERQLSTKTAANLRIQIDPRFQKVIDQFLTKLV